MSRHVGRHRFSLALVASGVLLMGTGALASPVHAESIRQRQWHLDALKAEEVWKTTQGYGVTVAVIDSRVDGSLPELRGRVLEGKDFSSGFDSAGDEENTHGTDMAELIAATGIGRRAPGGYGLAPKAHILPLSIPKRLGKTQASSVPRFLAQLSKAIRYAADSDARVINISLGADRGSDQLTRAVRYALSRDKLVFASAGNTGNFDAPVEYPAATPGVVAVAAVGRDAKATRESQHGPEVDLAAPGAGIVTSCGRGPGLYCKGDGTSAASALASASAALIWAEHPDWTANQVLRVMINTAGKPTDGVKRNDYIGYGVVRPRVALKDPGDPGPADVSPLPEVAALEKPETPEKTGKPGKPRPQGSSEQAAGKRERTAGREEKDDNLVPVGLGVGGVIVVLGVVTAVFVRRRRSAGSASG